MSKCGRCGKAIPQYSIEWRDLPDAEKCRCKSPVYPDGPLVALLRWLCRPK
jgi:hypothetical protein